MWHDTLSINLIVHYRVEGCGAARPGLWGRVQQCADCRSVLTIQPDERRLRREFVYLAVLLDAYSRRCIGWALGRTLEAELTLEALRRALARREVRPGLVHHSDRGVQYAAGDYTALLAQHGIVISMSRKASPNDNALAESFIKTLKIRRSLFVRVRGLRRSAAAHREVYRARLQRKAFALGVGLPAAGRIRTPARRVIAGWSCGGMSFLRHEEIYRSDGLGLCWSGAQSGQLQAPTHRFDEFPAGYSSAGCSPAEPASASPAGREFTMRTAPQPSIFERMGTTCLAGCLNSGVHRGELPSHGVEDQA